MSKRVLKENFKQLEAEMKQVMIGNRIDKLDLK